jgi:hypothetical protein
MVRNKTGKKSVRTPENIHFVEQALMQSSRKPLSRQLSMGASSAYRIIPYVKPQQAVCEADKASRVDFCGDFEMCFEDSPAVPSSIWFSDEAHFHLNGCMAKQNTCVCGPVNTYIT